VAVTDQQAAALRAFLSAQSEQDAQDAGQMFSQLADSDTAKGTGELIYAAFVVAARCKFAPGGPSPTSCVTWPTCVPAMLKTRTN
jgi:hypothetical protein